MMTIEEKFQDELEVFRCEVEGNIHLLYSYLTIHSIASRDKTVLDSLNKTPLFWNTCLYSLQCSFIIGLARIFDQNSNHNLDRVIKLAQDNPILFNKDSLAERKRKASDNADEWLDEFSKNVYEPTPDDFRRLRKSVNKYRGIYNEKYRGIRHSIYAHKLVSKRSEVESLCANTNYSELQSISIFLNKIYRVLWELYHNGRKPDLNNHYEKCQNLANQEDIVRETKSFLNMLSSQSIASPDAALPRR